jgi:hypothetical protein
MNAPCRRKRVYGTDQGELVMDNVSIERKKHDRGSVIPAARVATVRHVEAQLADLEVDHGVEIVDDEHDVTEAHQ